MEGKPSTTAMATDSDPDVTKLKGTKITVTVEDALIDVLVVTFHIGSKIFQGALLDVTKRNAPYGIVPPPAPKAEGGENATTEGTEGHEEKVDKLHSVKQRHTYYQVPPGTTNFFFGRYPRNSRDKSVRMRRLRPRKILCSHCQEIFNDGDLSQKKGVVTRNKNSQSQSSSTSSNSSCGPNQSNRVLTRSSKCESSDKKVDASNASEEKDSTAIKSESKSVKEEPEESTDCDYSVETVSPFQKSNQKAEKMVLRKRKLSFSDGVPTVHSPEKQKRVVALKSEEMALNVSSSEGSAAAAVGNSAIAIKSGLAKTSPVIKISFANPQGTDTVLKIPARVQLTSDTEEEANWSVQEKADATAEKSASAKAAKKALKKAKKEAQKKTTSSANAVVLSQNQENGTAASVLVSEKDKHHHHKHKVKKKRKHKEEEETDKCNSENTDTRNMFNSNSNDGWCLRTNYSGELPLGPSEVNNNKQGSVFEDVKNKCLHQKLSISLKRLNAKAYMRCSPKYSVEEDSIISDISDSSTGSVGSNDGSDYGDVPDFPKHSSPLRDMDKVKPLMMRISTHSVKKCVLDIGREMTVGDIVWGKIHGFPWWPGKVLALTVSQRDNGATINQQAHVSWFGSSTSSYMPCNQLTPFLEDFKLRYNKKKRGPYKEAIRQAWHEANIPHKDVHEMNLVTT